MKRNHLSLAIGLTLSLAAAHAQAQDPAEPAPASEGSTRTLDAVQVTARRREETLQEVPIAVTAFTAESLDKLNVRDLSDLGPQVPNLTIYAARGSSSTITAYIRGVGQSDPLWGVDPGVGIYLDDVYIARPQGALLDVFDVERIEVLRGPQGTLYGKNTIGGAIKYISRGLSTETQGMAQVTVGNYGQLDAKAAIGGSFDERDTLRGRLAVASLNRDGFGENTISGNDTSDKSILAVRGQVGAFVTDDFNIQFTVDWMDDTSGVRGAQMLAPNRFTPAFPPLDSRYDVRNGMPNINDTEMLGLSATANWRVNDDWSFKYILAKRESDTETNIDFDTTPVPIADVKAVYSDEQVSNEIQLNYDGGGRHRGVLGLYLFDGEAGGQVRNNFFGFLFGDTQGAVYTESLAVYGDWSIDLTEQWNLDVGVRWTDEDKRADVFNRGYSDGTYTTPISVVADFDKTINFTNVAPKISLGYQATDDILIYGLATRGFKSGGYNIRAQATAVPRSAEPFDDEVVDSFELGTKMAFLDRSLFLNLSTFYNKYEDIQLSVFTSFDSNGDGTDDAFFGDFTNAGQGTVKGIEVEYQWLPTRNWLISGNLAFLDAEYDEFIYAGVDIADEQEFTNAPEFSGALNVEYRTELANGGSLSARVSYTYQDDVIATTEINRAEVPPFGRPPISQSSYGLLSAGVIWQVNDSWMLSLQGSNLNDEEYLTTGYNLNRALGVYTGFYGAPRQYSLTARFEF